MTKKADVFTSQYLSVKDLAGRSVVVEISHSETKLIGNDSKEVLYFMGKDKGLVLNKTNWNMIEMLTGKEDTDDWVGVQITLQPSKTEYKGEVVPCIRVAPDLPKRQAQYAGEPQAEPVRAAAPTATDIDQYADDIPF